MLDKTQTGKRKGLPTQLPNMETAAPCGCPSLLQPLSWGRNLSSPEADSITASAEEAGPEENTAHTNKRTSSSSAHSCFLLSIQPFSLSLLLTSPFPLNGKPVSRFRKLIISASLKVMPICHPDPKINQAQTGKGYLKTYRMNTHLRKIKHKATYKFPFLLL